MAVWEVYEQADGNLGFNYRNQLTGQMHKCGVLRADTTAQCEASAFDAVFLPGKVVLLVLPQHVEREVAQTPVVARMDWRRRC